MDTYNSSFYGISIIVPAFNEASIIKEEILKILGVIKDSQIPFELIVVDDGSSDGTYEVISSIKDIRIFRHSKNRGYGASLKTGIKKSIYEIVCIVDSDGTYPAESIPGMFKKFVSDELDMLVGSRNGRDVNIPIIRKPAKWFINKLANYLANYKIPDLNSGLRIMKKDVVLSFFNILPSGFSFTTTITLAMLTNDYLVDYYSIDYYKRNGKSKIRPVYDTCNFILLIIRTITYFNPLKVYLPISLILLFGGISLLLLRAVYGQILISTTVSMFVGGFTILALGLLADLIDKRIR